MSQMVHFMRILYNNNLFDMYLLSTFHLPRTGLLVENAELNEAKSLPSRS